MDRPLPSRLRRSPLLGSALLLVLSACGDSLMEPDDLPPLEARRQNASLEVVTPGVGETLSGTVELRVRVSDGAAAALSWQVDWRGEQPLAPAADGDGWTAEADVSSWNWDTGGSYLLAFRARDAKGRKVAEALVEVRVAEAEEPDDGGGSDGGDGATGNPLIGGRLWVDPFSNARQQADAWAETRPVDAALMERIAANPQADWFGDWNRDVRKDVYLRTATIAAEGALPVLVAYNLPLRDCHSYSAGGARSPDAYRTWIRDFAAGLAGRAAVVVLEPDGLAQLDCLGAAERQVRLDLLADAVSVLVAAGAFVYLDAGHPHWHGHEVMAERLLAAGVRQARGFALNVSNFVSDADNVAYGQALAQRLGGVGFVIDTSRNGLGPDPDGAWCNPAGRALGAAPVLGTGVAGLDALLWIKRPGESDGTCNGGPQAGSWWADYALGLATRQPGHAAVMATAGG